VGSANGRNPVPIIVPCHRVINAGGGLGGYSCGLAYKRLLLELEGVHLEKQLHLLAHSAL
jgi:methylated-DNA-[protein]-cysteine S-methyltransferase